MRRVEPGKELSGFIVKSSQTLKELQARLYEMEHVKSGARLVWIDRAEENKTFGIAFRTLPKDDTGVFHILEHSVLCGSERYPVKEPFVELLKSSMKTFLNAMTFPDKTVYPFSSRNEKDFYNLMRVYMDAVFHPLIGFMPEIFEQEGWHYDLDQETGKVQIQGVVYNEMKGVFASPDAVLRNEAGKLLFPETCYGWVSGGDPEHIPELTYEQFTECYRHFYQPDNSYIVLDGDINIEETLSILDQEFLCAFTKKNRQPEIVMQNPVKSGPVKIYYEASPEESSENLARVAWGLVIGTYESREKQMAVQALAEVLCGSNQSPLKKRILDAQVAQDIRVHLMDGILQPYILLEVVNVEENRLEEAENIVKEEIAHLAEQGMDQEYLAAVLANMEFSFRERDYGNMPQGIGIALSVLDSWIYDGYPAANLEMEDIFRKLDRRLQEGWFENVLQEIFLKNPHSCQVIMLPSSTLGEDKRKQEEERVKAVQESWDEEEFQAAWRKQVKRSEWQKSKDTPELSAALPKLSLQDLPSSPEEIPAEEIMDGGIPFLRHSIDSGGISYVRLYFDISDFPQEELSDLSFLCRLLGNLNTEKYSGAELQKYRRMLMGNLSFSIEGYSKTKVPESCRRFLCVAFGALDEKLGDAAAFVAEMMMHTQFGEVNLIHAILCQTITVMEQNIIGAGSSFGMLRTMAGISVQGVVQESTHGLTYYYRLKELEHSFEKNGSGMEEKFKRYCNLIFDKSRLTVSITGRNEEAELVIKEGVISALFDLETFGKEKPVQLRKNRQEGIEIPGDVSYAVMGGRFFVPGENYNGAFRVLERLVSLEYLWNTVRVQGGAYGTGFRIGENGGACFYSYRDPDAKRSLACFQRTSEFLETFCKEDQDLTGLIIGAAAEAEPFMMPEKRGILADERYFKEINYPDLCRVWKEMLRTDQKTLKGMAAKMRYLEKEHSICVIGSRNQIEQCELEKEETHKL